MTLGFFPGAVTYSGNTYPGVLIGAVNSYLINLGQKFSTNKFSRAFQTHVKLNSLASSGPEALRNVVCLE